MRGFAGEVLGAGLREEQRGEHVDGVVPVEVVRVDGTGGRVVEEAVFADAGVVD